MIHNSRPTCFVLFCLRIFFCLHSWPALLRLNDLRWSSTALVKAQETAEPCQSIPDVPDWYFSSSKWSSRGHNEGNGPPIITPCPWAPKSLSQGTEEIEWGQRMEGPKWAERWMGWARRWISAEPSGNLEATGQLKHVHKKTVEWHFFFFSYWHHIAHPSCLYCAPEQST